jgi:hypothetical protein
VRTQWSKGEQAEAEARFRGLVSGAIHRGELLPLGTLVRFGRSGKVVYRIERYGVRILDPLRFDVQLVNTVPSPEGQGGWNSFWTDPAELRVV